MMKSFFKKLAFVMALAMVVSMVAPAAQTAVAAEEKKPLAIAYQKGAVITALNLAEVGATEDLRFVYAPENWKELGATWTSSNPNVVSVDANGVVEAKAAGTATVSVAVGAETASIEVYSVDMTTFVATMGNAEDRAKTELTLTVGEEFDFAFYGIKDYSVDRYNCEWWAVDPEGVIELNTDNGLVTAKKAGTAKLTLAVMNLVTLQKTDVAACVITVKDVEPEVDPNNFEVTKMASEYSFELTFEDKAITAEKIQAGLTSYYYIGDVRISFNGIKNIAVEDGVATVTMYSRLSNNTTYGFKYAGIEKELTVKIGTPTTLYLTWADDSTGTENVAWASYTTKFVPHILNENGAEITDSVLDANKGKIVTYELAQESVYANYWLVDGGIYFTTENTSAVVTATFFNGYDNMGQMVKTLVSAPTVIACTEKPAYSFPYQTAAVATVNGHVNWQATTNIAIGDSTELNPRYVGLKLKDVYGNEVLVGKANTIVDANTNEDLYCQWENHQNAQYQSYRGQFTFSTDNPAIFSVQSDGRIVANREGTANVLVYFDSNINNATSADKSLVAVVPVTVFPKRAVTTVTLEAASVEATASATTAVTTNGFNTAKVVVYLKDQLGDLIDLPAGHTLNLAQKSASILGISDPTISVGNLVKEDTGKYVATLTVAPGNVSGSNGTRYVYYAVKYNNAERVALTLKVVKPKNNQNPTYTFEDLTTEPWVSLDIVSGNGANRTFSIDLFERVSGIKVDTENVVKMTDLEWSYPQAATLHNTYVRVFKDGVDITNRQDALLRDIVTTTNNEVKVTLSNTLTDNKGMTIVDKTFGAGNYTVVAYKAVGTNNAASPSAMTQMASTSVNVTDTEAKAFYVKKNFDTVSKSSQAYLNNHISGDDAINTVAKVALEAKIDWRTFNAVNGWVNVVVKANGYMINNNMVYYESLDLYVPIDGFWGSSNTYVKYTIPVGDYVTITN